MVPPTVAGEKEKKVEKQNEHNNQHKAQPIINSDAEPKKKRLSYEGQLQQRCAIAYIFSYVLQEPPIETGV